MTPLSSVMISDIRNQALLFQSMNLKPISNLTVMLWPSVKKHVKSNAATKYSTSVILGLGGIRYLMVGTSEIKAINKAAIETTLSPNPSV
jgi:hypothetical protein